MSIFASPMIVRCSGCEIRMRVTSVSQRHCSRCRRIWLERWAEEELAGMSKAEIDEDREWDQKMRDMGFRA